MNEIINTFERKFNIFADSSNAFSSRFDHDDDSAIGTLCYNDFNVEFEYCLECGGMIEKSGLNIILDFSKRHSTPLKCMMYDIIGLADSGNFNCWFYCYIENAERMELCFDKLSADFISVLPKLREFISSDGSMERLEKVLAKNIKATVGIDYFKELKSELKNTDSTSVDDIYDYLFGLYFSFEQCAFASEEYRDFLAGDTKKALKRYEKKKNKLIYENLIIAYIKSNDEPKPIISKEYECLSDGLKEYYSNNGFVPFFVSAGILWIPFTALFLGIYFAVAFILNSSALYATPLEPYNSAFCVIPAMICSIAAGCFLKEKLYRRFFRKKYSCMKDYSAIFENKKSMRRLKILSYLVYILAVIAVFLYAGYGISFSETGITDKSNYLSVSGRYHSYNEVESAYYTVDDGIKSYTLLFDDGSSVDLAKFADNEDVENKIIPILNSVGISFFSL